MHARMSIFEGPPHRIDEGLRQAREVVLPQAKEIDPGFKGIIALTDRQGRKMVGITFWESEEAMRASEEAANRLREQTVEVAGGMVAGVERYEVGLFELEPNRAEAATPRPFFLPLFTGARGREILRSSPYRISRKFCSAPAPCGRASYVEYRRLLIRRT